MQQEKYGFVYIWRDRKHNRYYVGSHWGHTGDGYICSSSWMKQAYKRRPDDPNERLNTGIEEIDRIEWEVAISADPLAILTHDREFLVTEDGVSILQAPYSNSSTDPGIDIDPFAQNQEFEQVGEGIIDFTQIDPFSEGEY